MRTRALGTVLLIIAGCLLTGCNQLYHLRGHNEDNLRHPPDITMSVGERRKAVSTGLTLFVLAMPTMTSSDTNIVDFEYPDNETIYIVAYRPGVATVKYHHPIDRDNEGNEGFNVTVVERGK